MGHFSTFVNTGRLARRFHLCLQACCPCHSRTCIAHTFRAPCRTFSTPNAKEGPPNTQRGGFYCYEKTKTFRELNVDPTLVSALEKQGIVRPSRIQDTALPVIIGRATNDLRYETVDTESLVIGAETGSGKTLAYVIPIVQALMQAAKLKAAEESSSQTEEGTEKRSEANTTEQGRPAGKHYPTALVLVPSDDLARQVRTVFRGLLRGTQLRCYAATAEQPIGDAMGEVLVTTPQILARSLSEDMLRAARWLIVDECDMILTSKSQGLSAAFAEVASKLHFASRDDHLHGEGGALPRVILVGATLAEARVKELLGEQEPKRRLIVHKLFEYARWLRTPLLHYKPPNRRDEFVSVRQDLELRFKRLQREMGGASATNKKLAFFNRSDHLLKASQFLTKSGVSHLVIHEGVPVQQRSTVLNKFKNEGGRLLATDIVARGIDFHEVGHVIQVQMPTDIKTYMHRAGRTARAGTEGRVTSFFSKLDLGLVEAIEQCGEASLEPAFSRTRSPKKKARSRTFQGVPFRQRPPPRL